jgi:hypothetical protein
MVFRVATLLHGGRLQSKSDRSASPATIRTFATGITSYFQWIGMKRRRRRSMATSLEQLGILKQRLRGSRTVAVGIDTA